MTFSRYSSNFRVHFETLDLVFIIFRGFLFQMLERNSKQACLVISCVLGEIIG